MFCNGHGNILRKPFSIKNSPKGIEYLTQQVLSSRSIKEARADYKAGRVKSREEVFGN